MTVQDTTSPAYMYARRKEREAEAFAEARIKLLEDAAYALIEAAEYKFEKYTEHSCTDRQGWSREQRCRYGDEQAYEIAMKLLETING